jgi:hypothetical protein
MWILTLTLMLTEVSEVTHKETVSESDCHTQGRAWLVEKLSSTTDKDFAITYSCLEVK